VVGVGDSLLGWVRFGDGVGLELALWLGSELSLELGLCFGLGWCHGYRPG